MAAGRDLFARRGLRGTSVEELSRAAGISKGAFYRFFDSKEALLLALVDQMEVALQAEVEAAVRAEPKRGLQLLVEASVHAIERNPLIAVAMSEEGLRAVQSRPEAEQRQMLDRDVRLVDRVLGLLREEGADLAVSRDVLLGLMRSLVLVGVHRDDIGPELVDAVAMWVTGALSTAVSTAGSVPR